MDYLIVLLGFVIGALGAAVFLLWLITYDVRKENRGH